MQGEKLFDAKGKMILRALQQDARISFSELGRQVGLSSPAVAERVKRLEEAGIIQGYRAIINQESLGYPITAYIRISTTADKLIEADKMSKEIPEVLECHHVTGSDVMIIKVAVSSIRHLEEFISQLSRFGQTTTSIILSSPVTSRILEPTNSKHE